MNVINIKVPLLNSRCRIFWPYNKAEAAVWLAKNKVTDIELSDEQALGSCVYSDKKGALVFLKRWNGSDFDRHVLVHELCHAASFIRHAVGIEENNEKSELLAHLIDFLTKKALKGLA